MAHHLGKLAPRHVETKFVKINAEKAMFFVEKLTIRSLPTVALFFDGVCSNKIVGYQGLLDEEAFGTSELSIDDPKIDEWPTIRLARLLGSHGSINKEAIVDDEDVEVF